MSLHDARKRAARMLHATRERAAEIAMRELRRRGMSRDGIADELIARGYSYFEASCLLDGYGLPEPEGVPDDLDTEERLEVYDEVEDYEGEAPDEVMGPDDPPNG